MGKSLTMLGCSLVACVSLASCSDSTPSQPPQKKNPPPGVLAIDAADHPTPDHGAKSYRIGNSTIPAGDFEALKSKLKAAREALHKEDPNVPRLIVRADANVVAAAIAPIVLTAINSGFDFVDLDGNLPPPTPRNTVQDEPPPDPIMVRVYPSKDGPSAVYEMTGVGTVIASEDELCQHLKLRWKQLHELTDARSRDWARDVAILVEPRTDAKDEFTLDAYAQAIRAGFKRFSRVDLWLWFHPPHRPRQDNPPPRSDASVTVKSSLFDIPIDAHHVVFICDRSGSMAATFEQIRIDLLQSISRLRFQQDFAVFMMADGKPLELDPNGLIPASLESKIKAVEFLRGLTARGTTAAMPCLKRAFELLDSANPNKSGKAIYLISDGDFVDMAGANTYTTKDGKSLTGNDAVIQFLRDHNADKAVQVNAILLFSKDEEVTKVFKQIASENAGQFKHVSRDD